MNCFKPLFIIWFITIMMTVHSHPTDQRSLDTGKILDHMLRFERTISKLSRKLEQNELQMAAQAKVITAFNITSTRNALQINNMEKQLGKTAGSISFQVIQKGPSLTVGQREVLKFDTVTLNKEDAYNPKSGIFTTPITGIYIFWADVLSAHSSTFRLFLYKDGKVLVRSYIPSFSSDHGIAPLTFLTHAKKGEHIWFGNGGATTSIYGNIWSSYGGTLLSED